jgi:hypothetical protein
MTGALRVRLHRARLDRELANGRRPESSPEHHRRAEQLLDMRCRRELADGLRRLIADAEAPRAALTAAVAPHRGEVRAAREVLDALIERLLDDRPVRVRGVALVRVLLTDGASPAYTPRRPGALTEWARTALRALPPPAHHFELPA